MESWRIGREAILEQLTEVCNQIGQNISVELNDENYIRIDREELRLLKDNSSKVASLARHNARLQDELEICRAASARVGGLEMENKRLAEELERELKLREAVPASADQNALPRSSRVMPGPGEPSSSSTRIELGALTKEELIAKYISKCDKYDVMREAKGEAEKIAKREKQKNRDWNEYMSKQDRLIERKNDRIKRQDEDIQRLKAQLNGHNGVSGVLFEGELNPPFSLAGNDVQLPRTSPSKAQNEKRASDNAIDPEDLDLPRLDPNLPVYENDSHMAIHTTEFEDIEVHHTSSTEGSSDPIVPAEPESEETIVKYEPSRNSSPSSVEIIRTSHVTKRKTSGHTMETPVARRIKIEDLTSSPVGLAAFFNLNESIDLDDIGEKVVTPRKQRRIRELSRKASGLRSPSSPCSTQNRSQSRGESGSNSLRFIQPTSPILPSLRGRKDYVLQPQSINRQILPRTSDDRDPKKSKIHEAMGGLMEEGEIVITSPPEKVISSARERLNDLLIKSSPVKTVLSSARLAWPGQQAQPARTLAISGLVLQDTVSRLEGIGSSQKRRSPVKDSIAPCLPASTFKNGGQGMIPRPSSSPGKAAQDAISPRPHLAQTSAELTRPSSKGRTEDPEPFPRLSSRNLNIDFTELPPRPIRMTEFFKGTQTNTTPARQTNKEMTPSSKSPSRGSAEALAPSSRQSGQSTASKMQQGRRNANATDDHDVNPDDEPLRLRPLKSLTIRDFKVNPKYNQGNNYKFQEVIRGRDARKCLQGCTKPECCGQKFLALAEMSRNPEKPHTASQEEADERLLKEFLGDSAYQVRNMTKAERDEALLQAKTRDLANKYGRHRQAYERRSSPEGFWRVDFPTTQEQEADRARQKDKERQEVEKRYQEAMRPGGAYIFRDE